MLVVVPAARRRCSVRSVATAVKTKPEFQTPSELPADRAAALKWAPKPQPVVNTSSQAGPSTLPSFSGHTPPAWGTRLSATSKWARPTPAAAIPTVNSPAPASQPSLPKSAAEAANKWARPTPVGFSQPSSSAATSSPKSLSNNVPFKSSARSRWPSLNDSTAPDADDASNSDHTVARTRWGAPVESTDQRSRHYPPTPKFPSLGAKLPAAAGPWKSPDTSQPPSNLPSHLKWRPPERTGSPTPAPSPSTRGSTSTPILDTIDKLFPNESPKEPSPTLSADSRLQRDAAPHLQRDAAPHLQRDAAPHLQRDAAPHLQRDGAPHLQHAPAPHLQRHVVERSSPAFTRTPPLQTRAQAQLQPQTRPQPQPQPQHVPGYFGPSLDNQPTIRSKKTFKERGSLLRADAVDNPVIQINTAGPKVKKPWAYIEKRVTEDVYIPSTVSVGHLARLLSVRLEDLQDKMYRSGMGEQASFDYVLTSDYAVLLAEEFGRKPIVNDEAAFDLYPPPPHPNPETLPTRPPVVTIMGHVDHGKTTLLDTLRSSSVAQGEVGGITQHIGAFSVPVPSSAAGGSQSITFLDTPGHAAFSAMRARGAQVTDIIVLVVAADDGIMPQTREVIELIKKDREKIGVVVAINKIDKPGCNVDALQKGLLVEDIHLEELGGDVPSVEVSGLTGKGLPDLVETISLISEIQDLRAEPDGAVFGYVLESKVVKGLGPIATVLVLRGCLKPGSHILSGVHHAKVRIMHDSTGSIVKIASPGMAITVSGWKSIPDAGDEVLQGTESDIKRAIVNRQRKADIEASLEDVEAINSNRQQERDRRQAEAEAEAAGEAATTAPKAEEPTGPKELRLIIKADVSGSAEAVEGALQGIGNHLAVTKVISSGVGSIMESDVMKAKNIGGAIVGFSVSASRAVETLAAQNNVPIITSDIIYRLMEEVKTRVIGLLPVTLEFRVIGEAKVLQLFEIQMKGKVQKTIAGSRIINGLVEKNKPARVLRDGNIIFEGTFETMRHFKKEVTELRKGTECGLNLAGFDDLRVDDVIQTFETIEKPGIL
ncbi:hypothetical protein C8F04DRAFT_32239 [Mycena alexandri]|uniref:Translation initiation factor IF-2, mitochondrial n=1 Tax=Mycena alexandri TaxID=1745969 RepID=A0AAD6TFZ3_9AGAR|nr:hypothetical protein C8F04DRAFT_32239 [Mycena alexandri]